MNYRKGLSRFEEYLAKRLKDIGFNGYYSKEEKEWIMGLSNRKAKAIFYKLYRNISEYNSSGITWETDLLSLAGEWEKNKELAGILEEIYYRLMDFLDTQKHYEFYLITNQVYREIITWSYFDMLFEYRIIMQIEGVKHIIKKLFNIKRGL